MIENESTETVSGASMDRVVSQSSWSKRTLVGFGTVVLIVISGILVDRTDSERSVQISGDRIAIVTVQTGKFDDFIQVRGGITPLTTIFIDTVQGGQVEAIHVENGAQLQRGQLLVELSNTALQLEVISRETQITEQLNNLRSLDCYPTR